MKIGIYFPGYEPELGGGFTFEQEMLEALVQLAPEIQHQFTLIFGIEGIQHKKEKINFGDKIEVVFVFLGPWIIRVLYRLLMEFNHMRRKPIINPLQKQINERKIDIIWFPTPIYLPVESPFIATMWDIQHRLQPWFPEVSYQGNWNRRESYSGKFLQQATYIIANNETGKQELALFYQIPENRICALPHPTPTINYLPSNKEMTLVLQKYQISSPYLLYPAGFWAHKNHVNLLLALKNLLETCGLNFKLVLVGGDQGNLKYIETKVEQLGLGKSVHFLGFIQREDLIALYQGAFALLYITYFGPENLPPLEAFACGCPVIASNISGAEEQFEKAALLVNPNKPEEISNMVKYLYDNPDIRKVLIEKGYQHAKKFTNIDFVREVIHMLDEFEPVRRNWGN